MAGEDVVLTEVMNLWKPSRRVGQKVAWFQTLLHPPHLTFTLFVSSWPC